MSLSYINHEEAVNQRFTNILCLKKTRAQLWHIQWVDDNDGAHDEIRTL